MVSKGKPTARSQRYKANQTLIQEQARSVPMSPGSEVLPPPSPGLDKPVTPDDGEQRAFTSVRLLLQAMVLSSRPNTHIYEMLHLISSFVTDCEKFYQHAHARTISVQQQLDEANAKLLAQFELQNAEILNLQDELGKSKLKTDFYRQQAEKAQVVPSYLRRRMIIPASDLALSTDQLYQQVLFDRDAIAQRDAEIQRLQHQVLDTAAKLLETRIATLEQQFDLFLEFEPEAILDDEPTDPYVAPRRIGFYTWTARTWDRRDDELNTCRWEARIQADRAAAAQTQLATTQAALAQTRQQLSTAIACARSGATPPRR
mmetsp:Transcript_50366/g.105135  ORF Transcript_50366/g.105135 Transcript_50366/m.105135 type:complete len:316 (-) Transcript_50366:270-1217(-)